MEICNFRTRLKPLRTSACCRVNFHNINGRGPGQRQERQLILLAGQDGARSDVDSSTEEKKKNGLKKQKKDFDQLLGPQGPESWSK